MADTDEIINQIKELSEHVKRFTKTSDDGPTAMLFMAGIRSSLESIVRAIQHGRSDVDNFISVMNEVKAMIEVTNANVRAIRNKSFCPSGDSAVRQEMEKIRKENEEQSKPN